MNKSALITVTLIASLQAATATVLYLMFGIWGLVAAYCLSCAVQIGMALALEKADRSSLPDHAPVVVGILSSVVSRIRHS